MPILIINRLLVPQTSRNGHIYSSGSAASVASAAVSGGGSIPSLDAVCSVGSTTAKTLILQNPTDLTKQFSLSVDIGGNLRFDSLTGGSVVSSGDVIAYQSGTAQVAGFWDALGAHVDGTSITYSGGLLSASMGAVFPSQTGNSGKFLTTNGTAVSWGTVATDWNSLTGKPLTFTPSIHSHIWSDIASGKPTTLAGYGITDAQASSTAWNTGNLNLSTVAFNCSNLTTNGLLSVNSGTINTRIGSRNTWDGNLSAPTVYSSHPDEWVMFHNPHIPFLRNGYNGYSGTENGSKISMNTSPLGTNYWSIGCTTFTNETSVDAFRFFRNSKCLLAIDPSASLLSKGSGAAIGFEDRTTNSTSWSWYSQSNIARLYNSLTGDKLTIDSSGNLTANGNISSSIVLANNYYLNPGDGNGIRFWNSSTFSINMSSTAASGLANIDGDSLVDYNTYFIQSGNKRGFLFKTGDGAVNMHITGNGVWTKAIHCGQNTNGTALIDAFGGLAYFGCNTAANGMSINSSGNAAFVGSITATGDITAFSDINLKANLKPLQNTLKNIDKITGYQYTRTDLEDKSKVHIGLIAQEVEVYYPELVKTDEKGIKSLNYMGFCAVLLQQNKELLKRIEKLERKIK